MKLISSMLFKCFFILSIVAINVITFDIVEAFLSKSYQWPLRLTQNTLNAISNVVIGETNILDPMSMHWYYFLCIIWYVCMIWYPYIHTYSLCTSISHVTYILISAFAITSIYDTAIAMEAEADPFVQQLDLQLDNSFFPSNTPFRAFRGIYNDCCLIR